MASTTLAAVPRQSIQQRMGHWLAWLSFTAAAVVLGTIEWWVWQAILKSRNGSIDHYGVNFAPHMLGLLAALFVPMFWLFIAGILSTWTDRPRGRWLAFGWSLLTLAAAGPLIWHYRQTAEEFELAYAVRQLDVAWKLTATICIASLLPRPLRSGLGGGLGLCFVIVPGFGGLLVAFFHLLNTPLGLLGFESPHPGSVITNSLEYALICGIVVGLLFGTGTWVGWIKGHSEGNNVWNNKRHEGPSSGL